MSLIKSAHITKPPSPISHRIRKLSSGLTLVEVNQPHLHRGAVSVFFKAGSRFESDTQNGISHFLEHMMFRGSSGYPTTFEQNLAIEKLGGTLFAATAADCTEFELTLPRETLAEGILLLSTILSKPLFNEIDIERKVIVEEVLEDLDEDGNPIDIDFLSRRQLWPDHPLGQSIIGDIKNIETFSTDDISHHYQRSYVANNAVICLSGGFDAHIPQVATEAFSCLPRGEVLSFSVLPTLAKGPALHHIKKPGSQTQLRLTFHAPGENAPDNVPLMVLLGILDDGMSTRLHKRLFDELGLAYNVSAGIESYHDVSAFNFDVTVSHKNAPKVVAELLEITRELCEETVPQDELKKATQRAVWGIDDYLDDPHGMAAWYGEQALFRAPPTLDSRKADIQAVTADDILLVAKKVFTPSNLHLTTVGGITSRLARDIDKTVERYQ